MVLPLLALAAGAATRVAAGAAVRGVATRAVAGAGAKAAVNSMGGKVAAQAIGNYGVNALQRAHNQRQMAQGQMPQQNLGARDWARQHPGQAAAAATTLGYNAMTRSSNMSDRAAAQSQSILQNSQFQ